MSACSFIINISAASLMKLPSPKNSTSTLFMCFCTDAWFYTKFMWCTFFWPKFKTPKLLQIPLEKCAINDLRGKKNVEQVELSTGYR